MAGRYSWFRAAPATGVVTCAPLGSPLGAPLGAPMGTPLGARLSASLAAFMAAAVLTNAAHAAMTVTKSKTQNVVCNAGLCTAQAANAILDVHTLVQLLATGNVTLDAGAAAGSIVVNDPITWSSASSLTLSAPQSILMNAAVTVGGPAAVTIAAPAGLPLFGLKGTLQFLQPAAASLTINGTAYTLVSNLADLAAAVAATPAGSFALAQSYDATQDGVYAASPVETPLAGTFEGLGNSIANLSVNAASDTALGLFAAISGGAVQDLRLTTAAITSTSTAPGASVGAIAGSLQPGTLTSVSVSGTVAAPNGATAGAIAGQGVGTIAYGVSTAAVSSTGVAGGLAGYLDGQIQQSFATGAVTGVTAAGGLIGYWDNATIEYAYASGTVTADIAGGLLGEINDCGQSCTQPQGSLVQAYAIGPVDGPEYAPLGGLIGIWDTAFTLQADVWSRQTTKQYYAVAGSTPPGATNLAPGKFRARLPKGFDPTIWGRNPTINHGHPYLLANPPS